MLRLINLCLTLNEAIFIWGCRKKKNPYSYPRILLTSQKDGKIVGRDPGIFSEAAGGGSNGLYRLGDYLPSASVKHFIRRVTDSLPEFVF